MLLCSQVYVTIKDNLFEASEAKKNLAEIALLLWWEGVNPNVWIHADGVGDHHVGHPSVIASTINMYLKMNGIVDRLVKTRGCPCHSYLHEVERVMSILNLALYGVAMERPIICQEESPGMEHLFTSAKTTADVRAAGKRFPALVADLDKAVTPIYDMLHEHSKRLDLKGTEFQHGVKCSATQADAFFNRIKVY